MHLPSSHRPIPLVRRSDLQVTRMSLRGDQHVVVKDPVALRYFQIPLLQYQVLDALDGRRSLNEICSLIQHVGTFVAVGRAEILRLIMDLASKRLIWSQRPGTSPALIFETDVAARRGFWAIVSNPFFIKFPGVHPGQTLNRLSRRLGWIYSGPAAAASAMFILCSWLLVVLHLETFLQDLPTVSSLLTGQGIWTLWLVVGMLKVVHELSHGLACERFGAECQSIGLAFLFFSPCMYCDVTDAWMLERRRHRIAISMAGVYVELLISSLALWMWWFSTPGLFHQVCLQVFLAGSVSTLFLNANPLLRFDGYYVLADLLEMPNLYQRSRQAIHRLGARILLGICVQDESPASRTDRTPILVTYGLASIAYQVPMLIGLVLFLHGMFEAIGLMAIVWIYLLGRLTVIAGRMLRWSIQMGARQKSPARTFGRSLISAACCGSGLVAAWFCPLPGSMNAPIVIEPIAAQPVYVETPGIVCNVWASEGDVIEAGTVIAELENFEVDRRLVTLEGLLASHQTDFRMAQGIGDPDLMKLAETAIESMSSQIEHVRSEKERLQLRASISGILISTANNENRSDASLTNVMEQSAGMLNSRLIGKRLAPRSCLCRIVPHRDWQASLWIDQRNRQHLSLGQRVAIRLNAFSGNVVVGTVASIGAANEAAVPMALSTKYGGRFITQTTAAGEQPEEPIYRATLNLEALSLPVTTGMQGTGRYTRPAMSIGSWLTDEFHRLFVVG